jgi:hypothetical protein
MTIRKLKPNIILVWKIKVWGIKELLKKRYKKNTRMAFWNKKRLLNVENDNTELDVYVFDKIKLIFTKTKTYEQNLSFWLI